jgi:hypothetical protein
MDAMIEIEIAGPELIKPRRATGYDRMKRKNQYLTNDISALEGLAGTLLNHLERAISVDLTDQDRDGYRAMIINIRKQLESSS